MTSNNHNITTEIEKFEQLMDEWWSLEGELRTLHHINPARLNYIKTHANLTNKRLLDVGCGGGILTESLAKEGAITTGIDKAASAIEVAKKHASDNALNIDYHATDITEFAAEKKDHYDIIICMELLEHIENPDVLVTTLANMLKPNGKLFLSTLNRTPKAYVFAILGAEYILKLLPKGTHDYARFIKPSELSRWARNINLKPINAAGLNYNPWKKTANIVSNIDINYLMCFEK